MKMLHPIDLNAPGGLDLLFALHRKTFGSATMRINPEAPEVTDPPEPTDPTKPSTTEDEKLKEPGLRALQAERDARAAAERELATFRQEKADRDRAEQTEAQRAQADAAAAVARAEKAELNVLRLQAIADHSIPKDEQDLVTGTDAASFEASAKRVAALIARAGGAKKGPDVVDDQGKGGGSNASEGSVQAGRDLYNQTHGKKK